MSASDFNGRLFVPVMARPRRPLSSNASTDSWSMRFSLRTMMSGALSSSRRRRRLLRLMTRRYRSFRSGVAKRPPSRGTSGRRSGGSTGSTVMTIHSGLLPESMKLSMSLRRLERRLSLVSDDVPAISSRTLPSSACRSMLFDGFEVHFIGEQLAAGQRRHARIDDHEGLEVQHALDFTQRHVEHQADTRRQRLQEPDVRGRARELDVAHALAAHLGLRHFDAAFLADHAAVLEALVLAAQALVVLHRSEDLGAEQAVTFRLERAVVDGLRLLDLAVRPGTDHVRRSQADLDAVELFDRSVLLEKLEKVFHVVCSLILFQLDVDAERTYLFDQ